MPNINKYIYLSTLSIELQRIESHFAALLDHSASIDHVGRRPLNCRRTAAATANAVDNLADAADTAAVAAAAAAVTAAVAATHTASVFSPAAAILPATSNSTSNSTPRCALNQFWSKTFRES